MLLNALASLGHKGIKTLENCSGGGWVNVIQCAGRQTGNLQTCCAPAL